MSSFDEGSVLAASAISNRSVDLYNETTKPATKQDLYT